MASSKLCLTIDKGPKEGETLACNPGTVICIGRLVRGNTLAIKDPSISQKHLTVFFLPHITRWVVTDLGSSNGTFINGSLIAPDEHSPLSDGDVIKIGEWTSISVHIFTPAYQPLVLPTCALPPRPPKKADLEDKGRVENVDEPSKNGQRGRGRGVGRSTRFSRKDDALESGLVERRVTRSLSRSDSVKVFVKKVEKEKQSKQNNDRGEEEVVAMDGENNSRVEEVRNNLDAISKENNAGVEEEVLTVDGRNNSRVEEVDDNMNNMTLGEWFDRMEEYLPKSINKVAEEIIDKLREKSQSFDQYFSQTSNVVSILD